MPGKPTVDECWRLYRSHVGLTDDWESVYDDWVEGRMKAEISVDAGEVRVNATKLRRSKAESKTLENRFYNKIEEITGYERQ